MIAIDDEILAQGVAAVDDDMHMRMAGVVVIDGDPIELGAEVGFNLRHQLASIAGQVGKIGGVFR
ncbi:MAG: hypothetical protein E6R12_01975 [Sphingomonadales bacterium]|nr:MAG: hypothetical protein E6R12_01975 [Sphingomonadales bacterium]